MLVGGCKDQVKDFIERHPIILGSHPLVEEMVHHCHKKRGHSGVEVIIGLPVREVLDSKWPWNHSSCENQMC